MVAHRTAAQVQEELRGRLYDKIAELGPAWFAGERTGGVMLSIVDGVEQLQTFFGQYVPQVAIAVLTPIAIFAFIACWDVPVATVMLVSALVTLIAPTVFRQDRAPQQPGPPAGAQSLRLGIPRRRPGPADPEGIRPEHAPMAIVWPSGRGSCATRPCASCRPSVMTRGITDCGVAIGAAAALGSARGGSRTAQMSIEALLIVLMAGTEVFRPLRDLRTVLHQGMLGQSAAAGINELFAAEPWSPSSSPHARRTPSRWPRPSPSRTSGSPIPAAAARRMTGCRFTVAAGEKIGIVGPSGSGKSSVARLLLRLFDPQQGSGPDRRPRSAHARPRGGPPDDRGRAPGHVPVPRHGRGEFAARQARRRPAPRSRPRRATPTRTNSSRAAARLRRR